ncbi:MAG: TSUP family transporter, partial [Candidatus Methanoperedens sp.]|nr:TSUP family transporter [Candidatus Methanoperedens sp.]
MDDIIILSGLIFAAGLLYSSVGHAGASGYLAVMALFGLAPDTMKPTALILNILVAAIAAAQFHRAGYFSWKTFWPFAIGSIPFAFIGGAMSIPGNI